jgi:hypothetical protein
MRWWPSTPISPQTVATMDVLRSFHVMNLQARLAPTDFYRSLERLSDGQGLVNLPVSIESCHSIPVFTNRRTGSIGAVHASGSSMETHQDGKESRSRACSYRH